MVQGEVVRAEIPLSSAIREVSEGQQAQEMSVVDPRKQHQDSDNEGNEGCVQENVP
jgi:hypothetical protein